MGTPRGNTEDQREQLPGRKVDKVPLNFPVLVEEPSGMRGPRPNDLVSQANFSRWACKGVVPTAAEPQAVRQRRAIRRVFGNPENINSTESALGASNDTSL